jgi:MtrB/PioB family decaheme-associated outer membrane protein
MRHNNACGFGAGSMRAVAGVFGTLVLLAASAAGQSVPQNTSGKNPGTQVPPGSANAAQTTAASQTTPQKKIQLGVGWVNGNSFKFGEYNGLGSSGPFGIGNFDIRGGAAYDGSDTYRWRFQGSNLGLQNRNVSIEFGKQGLYQVRIGYDEILANRSDQFQTPYLGAGANNLTLPSNWIKPRVTQVNANNLNLRSLDPVVGAGSFYSTSGVLTAPTPAQLATLASIIAADVPDFKNVNLATKRIRGEAQIVVSPNEKLDIPASYSRENKGGKKALGVVTSQVNENAAIIPYTVNWDTSQTSAAVNYKSKKLFLSGGYYGSYFTNNTASMTWQDVADPTKTATLAEEPSNQFNQFTAIAAFKMSSAAKLVVAGSYGRNTQNQAFLGPTTAQNGQLAFGLPRTSLGGLVVNSMFQVKFTAKKGRWDYVAAYKFEDRDNQTPVSIYLFQDANEAKSGISPFAGLNGLPAALGSNTNIYNNRAYSKLSHDVKLEAEFAPNKVHFFTVRYDWDRTDRSCSVSWIACSDAPTVTENTIRAGYHKTRGAFTARVDYDFGFRRGTYNENAFLSLVPEANVTPAGGASTSVWGYLQKTGLTGFGPVAGLPSAPLTGDAAIFTPNNNIVPQALYGSRNNINEIPGLRRYFVADRNQNHARAEFQWQAAEKFALQGTGQATDNNYVSSTYGLRRDTAWAATMDASYTPTTNFVADVFYTYDNRRYNAAGDAYGSNSTTAFQGQAGNTAISGGCFATIVARNASAKIDPCLNFFKNDRDKVDTVGLTLRSENLAGKKLQLATEVMYTRARTSTGVSGGSYVNNPLALAAPAPPLASGTPAVFFIPAQDYPLIRNDEISVVPNATYEISKSASLQGFYWYQKLMASDWIYQGLQYGTGTNYLPTNEKAPSYSTNVAGLSLNWVF